MKSKIFKSSVSAFVAVSCLVGPSAFADKVSQLDLVKKELRAAPAAEMPAKAALMVSQAKAESVEATTEAVVTAGAQLRPVAIVSVVSAIAQQNSAMAPVAAGKAAALLPKEAVAIARAAAGAAPAMAGKIVFAVCKAAPTKYGAVATAVSQVAPDATKEILEAIVAAVPGLKPFVERVSAKSDSMAAMMGQTEALVEATALSAKVTAEKVVTTPLSPSGAPVFALPPPTVGGPFTPPVGGTPINGSSTVVVPPGGGRSYSGP